MTVGTSTLSGNTADFSAGGGIFNASGMLTVTSATLSENSSNFSGGGIYNATGTVTLKNTIVANSLSGGNCFGSISDSGGNLSWPDTTCPGTNVDPLFDLSGLQDNGGATETIALQAGSPAIDGGTATCGTDDQRGVERPQGTACDNGAFEMPEGVAGVIVDSQATLGSTGRVTVRGEILCGPTGDSFALLVRVDQSSTGAVTKIGFFQGICSGDPNDPWANRPPKKTGSPAFQPGAARACIQARTYAGSTETDRVTFCNSVTIV
jgi:predicted outer membrane repeat protein